MGINKYEPMNILNEFQKLFNDRAGMVDDESRVETSHWLPSVDIKEEDEKFVILADLPGVNKEDIHVHMENNMLTIKGERAEEHKEESKNYSRVERVKGSFYRRFNLPETADSSKISATSNNGVLTISIPKKDEQQPRRIEVADE